MNNNYANPKNSCIFISQEKAFKFTERLAISKNLDIFEGMSLVNTGSARSARSYEPLLEEPKARELQLDERISDNVGDFFDNHVLQLRLTEPDNESRGLDEEGKNFKYQSPINVSLSDHLIYCESNSIESANYIKTKKKF